MRTSPSPLHGSLCEAERWMAVFVNLTDVEQGSRQDRRPGMTGSGELIEAGVSVVRVVAI